MILKKIYLLMMLMFFGGMGAMPTASAETVCQELNDGWRFRQARLLQWRTATVPGVVHTDLLAHGLIEDPYFRLNERSVQWVDKEDWIYETTFDIPANMRDRRSFRLVFKGLDTHADVELNGEKILLADNMFREWLVDVSGKLRETGNVLQIYFHSPLKVDMPKWEGTPFRYKAENDQAQNGGIFKSRLSIFSRKAGYHYGWDWGPRLVTSGIWRPILLEAWDDSRIENVAIQSKNVTAHSANVVCEVEISSKKAVSDAKILVFDAKGNQLLGMTSCYLNEGTNRVKVDFKLRNPRLWWCNGLGEPELYTFRTELSYGGVRVDKYDETTGIRSIELVRENDKDGLSFYFKLNGVRVFAKGSNYIPSDNFLPRVTREIYEKTIADAAAVHMNMLRVWGGGIYENDEFYELCDRYGILVWQDFMFACSLYPAEGEFLENIRKEAVDNVKRLRNHPCMAVWCGNNENQTAWFSWGWKEFYEKQNPEYAKTVWKQYEDQYFVTLADVVEKYGLDVAYTPSSPFSTKDKGQSDKEGDRHFWGVWNGRYPMSAFRDERSRFFSEYGFQSFPEYETVKRYAPDIRDHDILSDAMMWHQRGGKNANERIRKRMLEEYQNPKGFDNFLYLSQLLQADAVKIAMESHRRNKPYCMGTLYWQINDCWPVASWSSRDYYGRWKALHYYVARAFDDILVSPLVIDDTLETWVVSDRLRPIRGKLNVDIYTLNGQRVNGIERSIRLNADESLKVCELNVKKLIGNYSPSEVVVHCSFTPNGEKKQYANNCYLLKHKDINFPKAKIEKTIEPKEYGYLLTLQSDKFACGVCLELDGQDYFFTDNYFDLMPGKKVVIKAHTDLPLQEFKQQLRIKTLKETYE